MPDWPVSSLDGAEPRAIAIPGGSFRMGSATGRPDERPVRVVTVPAFEMAATPVTVRQYGGFLAAWRVEPPPWWSSPDFDAPDQPVVGVSWFEATLYGNWLGQETGTAWRLPTEVEWERAARGGLEDAPTAWGASLPPGEIPDGPLRGPWAVGRGTPNGYGLFDMGTVVHEWCQDVYRAYPGPEGDHGNEPPEATATVELRRVSRGGSWRHRQRWSSPAARSSLPPSFRYADYGFRVARSVLKA
jgi:formylglycine-generating enzyme required for sulfatase activity